MKNNQKGSVNVILIGIIVILVAFGGYFIWSKKTVAPVVSQIDTSNWKIYENITCGYSISYPKDWAIDSKDYHMVFLLPKLEEQMLTAVDYRADINIYCDSTNAKSLDELTVNFQNKKEITFNKIEAYETTMLGIPSGIIQIIAFSNNNHLYRIDYDASNTTLKVLSTFKFTK